jgi:peptidoglycan/xylan/chitin deacetylase (PgdA/CDA1 family)
MARALILMYHRLSDELPLDREEWVYTVPPAWFVEQVDRLRERTAPVVALATLTDGRYPDRSVVLTFDDGCDTDATVALPVLKAAGFPATFFLNPALLGSPGRMSWEQVEALLEAGMEVGSHGLDHTLLDELSDEELQRQLEGSKEMLEGRLGRAVEALSLPGGSGGRRAVRIAFASGYRLVLGSAPGRLSGSPRARALPRVALRRGESLEQVAPLFEQRRSALLQQALRYRAAWLARSVLGRGGYKRAKEWIFGRWFAPRPRPTGRPRAGQGPAGGKGEHGIVG